MLESVKAATPTGSSGGGQRRAPGAAVVVWSTLCTFLIVLVAMASALRAPRRKPAPARTLIVRRIYRTTIVERLVPAGSRAVAGPTVVSSSGSVAPNPTPVAPAPVTRAS